MSVDSQSSTLHIETSVSPPFTEKSINEEESGGQVQDNSIVCLTSDGGLDAWMTVAGTWLIQFCTYGYISAFGAYQDFYTRILHLSFKNLCSFTPPKKSWIGSFQLFMQYAPGVLVGRAFDAGYFRYMIAAGSILQVFSMFMLSLTQRGQYYQVFLSQAVGMGLGQSLLFLPSITIIGHHFKRRRALATGIALSGASVGGIIWPIMLNQLRDRVSFANGIRATGALAGFFLLIANIITKSKPSMNMRTLQQTANSIKPNFRDIFSDSAYLISIGAAFCISLGLFFPYFYLQLYAVEKGIAEGLTFYVVTILNAGSFFGRLLPNFIADRIGPYNMLIPCLIISSILAFSIFGIHSFAGVVVFSFLYGFWSGSYVSLIPSLLTQLCTHPGEHGTRMGLAFTLVAIALLTGSPIEGALIKTGSTEYTWPKSVIFCGIMVLFGAILMVLSRHIFVRRKGNGSRV
ncbi:major facilitator superfamily domain-containing protein [Collybia nuda]|uniref:Major facilitator superfamily domain-containing protein n=1 Tax=Collybia nuda TaxID=64659 RepID=A0A9P6CJW5_9AGAR|nr:major facilitator superfamily domain-containing protein [Collybia nuda]